MFGYGVSMVQRLQPTANSEQWDDPNQCPFCGETLTNGGSAFMSHIRMNDPCKTEFEMWRTHVRNDINGEWSG
jgi:hypothetical protein